VLQVCDEFSLSLSLFSLDQAPSKEASEPLLTDMLALADSAFYLSRALDEAADTDPFLDLNTPVSRVMPPRTASCGWCAL